MKRVVPILVIGLAAALAACEQVALVGLIENNNYKTTGRSVSGWALSGLSEEDCEPMRVFERKPVCRPFEPRRDAPAYCYRTLAAVTCYDERDPGFPPGQYLPPPGQ